MTQHHCNQPIGRANGEIWRCGCGRVWRRSHKGWYRLGRILRWVHGA